MQQDCNMMDNQANQPEIEMGFEEAGLDAHGFGNYSAAK